MEHFSTTEVIRISGISRRQWEFLRRSNFIPITDDGVSWNILLALTIYHQLHAFYTRDECRIMLSQMVTLDRAIKRDFGDRDLIMFSAFNDFKLHLHHLQGLEEWYKHKWIIRLLKREKTAEAGSIRYKGNDAIVEDPRYNSLVCCYVKAATKLIQKNWQQKAPTRN